MQDPSSIYSQMKPQFPDQEVLKCPRCDSINTKFCYYNNYNLSQPRHFCKNCKRYWTKGGILRNIPVGGSSRKNTKRSSSSSSSSSSSCSKRSLTTSSSSSSSTQNEKIEVFATPAVPAFDQESPILDSNGPFGPLLASLNPNGPDSGFVSGSDYVVAQNENDSKDQYLGDQSNEDSNCWNVSTNSWADLAIYTPGSRFQ